MKKDKCLVPFCKKFSKIRGLCPNHYLQARFLISKKKTSWEELEKRKKILPSKTKGATGWFLS